MYRPQPQFRKADFPRSGSWLNFRALLPSWWPQGLPRGLCRPPLPLGHSTEPASLRGGTASPDTGWPAARGGALAPAEVRPGGRKALLIPWEKAPWQAEKRRCLHPALPWGHGTPSPRSARQALRPSVLPTPPGAWAGIPAVPILKGIYSFALFLSNDWGDWEEKGLVALGSL